MVLIFPWQFLDAPSLGKAGDNTKNNKNPYQNGGKCNCKFSSICVAENRVA